MSWRNILLTGSTGFIGGELAPRLVERGYKVYKLERYVTGECILGLPIYYGLTEEQQELIIDTIESALRR